MFRKFSLLCIVLSASLIVAQALGEVPAPKKGVPARRPATTIDNTPTKEAPPIPLGPPLKGASIEEPNDGTDAAPNNDIALTPSEAARSPEGVPEARTEESERSASEGDPNATESHPDDASPIPLPSELQEPPLSPEMEKLRNKVRQTLMTYYQEPISTSDFSPWGIMHALIAYGVDTEIYAGGKKVNAIGWLCYNGPCRGTQLLYLENGKLRVRIGPGVQGHPGQFLSMLAQSKVKTDFPIKVEGRDFTVADLIESEKETCRSRTELTFKLIALSHYLKTDDKWKNDLGEEWSIPKLIKEELAQNVVGAACGGTHRMTGFSYAVNKRTKLNEEFDGQWLRAQKFVTAYHEYIFKLQNPDGSFSTNWFAGRGDFGEAPRRLETTGHMLEWLVCSLPKEDLDDPRVVKTVNYLADVFLTGHRQNKRWEIGPRGHALHGLAIYNERRFGDSPGKRDEVLARKKPAPQEEAETTKR